MPWQVTNAVVLHAGNTIINPNGLFTYSGPPAAGNLIVSDAPAAGTDDFGNAYVQGVAAYVTIGGDTIALQLGQGSFAGTPAAAFFTHDQTSPANSDPMVGAVNASAGGCSMVLYSGKSLAGSVGAGIQATDSTLSGIVSGTVSLQAGQVSLGASSAAVWNDNTQQLNLPAGGGPFILSEGFRTLGNPAGITGTCRIKKLPWNAIWLEGEVTWSGTTGATLTFGAPPDSTYSPTTALHRDVASTATPSAVSNPGRLFIPTGGGGPQLITPTVTGANTSWGWSVIYPNN